MTLDDYRAFIAEGIHYSTHDRMTYLHVGLMGEAGEVAGVYAKHRRDCGYRLPLLDCSVHCPSLIEELGDLLWFVVELDDGHATNWDELPTWHEPIYGIGAALSLLASGVAGAMERYSRGHWCDASDLAQVMGCVDYLRAAGLAMPDEMGMSREELAKANVDKLTIRRAIAAMEGV